MSKSFGRGAAALAVISIISKLLGALYRVPLTNILGAEGMGVYQTVFPVFTVLLMICGGGMTGAVSRTVAKYSARGNSVEIKDIFIASAAPLFIFSVASSAAVIIFRKSISALQGVPDASGAYLALCPSLVFCSVISVIRGIFQGRSMMTPSGISQLIEQGVKLVLGLCFGKLFMPRGVRYGVYGALLGVTVSEIAALIYLLIRYFLFVKIKNVTEKKSQSRRELRKEIMRFSIPVTLGMLIIPLTQVFDSAVVVNMLVGLGTGRADATKLFGLYVGPVGTLINMPAVVLSALTTAFLPALTAYVESGDSDGVRSVSESALKYTIIIALPVSAAFLFFPQHICSVLYGGLSAEEIAASARLLAIESVSVLYVGVIGYTTAVMQAHGRAHVPAINLAVGGAVKIALSLLLIPRIGIDGAAVSNAACYGVAALLGARSIVKYNGSVGISAQVCIRPLLFTFLSCVVFYTVNRALGDGNISVIVSGGAYLFVYACIIPSMLARSRTQLFVSAFGKQKRLKK